MNAESVEWSLPLTILAVGLALGALFVWLARRGRGGQGPPSGAAPSLELRDLSGRRDAIVGQLRELEGTGAKFTAEQLASQRAALELELARVLKAIDERDAGAGGARSPKTAAAAPAVTPGVNPTFKGFLWGVASSAAVAGLFFWVARVAEPRREGGSLTGEIPARGSAPSAPQAGPASANEQALQAAIAKNPDDFDARIGLAQAALARNDMMGVWNQTQYVLERQPGEPHALTYQALVRVAMGQAEMAVPMLKQAIDTQPDLADAYMHLALAYLRLGRTKEASQIIATARKRFPEDAAAIDGLFAQMRARVKKAPDAGDDKALPAGPDNPHAKLDAETAPPAMSAPAASGHRVAGTIELDPALKTPASGGVLFVLARPAGVSAGPPVAVKRLVASTFPLAFELSDGDSMTGQPLPEKVRIEARLDADGDAATRDPNDPKGALDNVAVGAGGLKLVLSR